MQSDALKFIRKHIAIFTIATFFLIVLTVVQLGFAIGDSTVAGSALAVVLAVLASGASAVGLISRRESAGPTDPPAAGDE